MPNIWRRFLASNSANRFEAVIFASAWFLMAAVPAILGGAIAHHVGMMIGGMLGIGFLWYVMHFLQPRGDGYGQKIYLLRFFVTEPPFASADLVQASIKGQFRQCMTLTAPHTAGIEFRSFQETLGTAVISGSEESIAHLSEFLKLNHLGEIVPSDAVEFEAA